MKVSPAGIELIHRFESMSLTAYPDPKTGGDPWTIGYGATGEGIGPGVVWTHAQAADRFVQDIARFERGVESLVTREMTQGQFDALVSFAYNVGLDIDADTKAEGLGDSTLLRKFNAGDIGGAETEWMKWVSPGSSVVKGLTRRRMAELELFRS